jgi:hypothetical protein
MPINNSNIRDIIDKVNFWAKENAKTDYLYDSRQSYFVFALQQNVITQNDYKAAEKHYGNLWTYQGD